MTTTITICLVLITIALIFGSDAARDLLRGLSYLIVLIFMIAVVGVILLLVIFSI